MKTKLSIIAVTAMLFFSSCEKNGGNQAEGNDPTPISFVNARVEGGTKALELTTTFKDQEKIGVYADLVTGTTEANSYNFMSPNTEVTYTLLPPSWDYTPLSYWPVTASTTLNFFAYHPYSATESLAAVGTSTPVIKVANGDAKSGFDIHHWVNTAPASQEDLLWDWVIGATKANPSGETVAETAGGATKFAFKHALSKIMFKTELTGGLAVTDDATTKIYITGLKINANQKGVFTTLSSNTVVTDPTWAVTPGSKVDFPIMTGLDQQCRVVAVAPLNLTTDGTADTQKHYELLMLPQAATDIVITLNYKVVTLSGANTTTTPGEKIFNSGNGIAAWEQGKQYTYTLKIGLDAITFDVATVDGWGSGTAGDLI